MIARDRYGRRYLEILPFDDGVVKHALAAEPEPLHRCVDCGAPLVHGTDRYFQRTDPVIGGSPQQRVLRMLDYDPVCGACGDRLVARAAIELSTTT